MNPRRLQKYLWGEFFYSNKQVFKRPQSASNKHMFVQFVMEPLVKEYNKYFSSDMVFNSAEYREAR